MKFKFAEDILNEKINVNSTASGPISAENMINDEILV